MTQCTARSKRTGNQCGAHAVPGRTTCRHHGGNNGVGMAHPQYVHGRRCRVLPTALVTRFADAMTDPDKLAMDAELALLDTRLDDAVAALSTGDSTKLWADVQSVWGDFTAARRANQVDRLPVLLETLGALIERGGDLPAVWDDIHRLTRERTRLVESERRRLIDAQQVITVEQAMLLNQLLIDAVRRHVTDPAALRAVADEWQRLASGGRLRPIGAATGNGRQR